MTDKSDLESYGLKKILKGKLGACGVWICPTIGADIKLSSCFKMNGNLSCRCYAS